MPLRRNTWADNFETAPPFLVPSGHVRMNSQILEGFRHELTIELMYWVRCNATHGAIPNPASIAKLNGSLTHKIEVFTTQR